MDTNSNITAEKKVVSVEILHLDELGYGPQGKLTRREWRAECLRYFLAGADDFFAWQFSWAKKEEGNKEYANFSYGIKSIYGKATTADFQSHRCTLDFTGHVFYQCIASNCIFEQDAWFGGATFEGDTWFDNVIFTKDVWFDGAIFMGDAYFVNTKFKAQSRFDGFVNNEIEVRKGAIFEKLAVFENSVFDNVGHFERVHFNTKIPSFLGVANDKTRLEFSDDGFFCKTDITEDSVKRLGVLKRLADEHGQTDQALDFNALELHAKAGLPSGGLFFKIITWAYEKLSNYGRSYGRPLVVYLILISMTYSMALFYAANSSPQDCKGELWRVLSDWRDNGWPSCLSAELPDDKLKLNGYRAALEYTTYRAAGILDFSDNDKQTVAVSKRLFNADVEPTWMRFWGIFKAIASAALLFLAALGLRNKYRIK